MKSINLRPAIGALILITAPIVSFSSTALAEHGSGSGGSGSGSVSSSSNTTKTEDTQSTTTTNTASKPEDKTASTTSAGKEVETPEVKSMVAKIKSESTDTSKDSLRYKESDVLKQKRQTTCESRKSAISSRIAATETAAQTALDKIGSNYTKVKAFKEAKNLTVANYDQLISATDSAQSDATTKVAALKAVATTVDCTNQNVADGLTAYRTALSSARDSLKAYRAAVVALIAAVHQAAGTADSSSVNNQTN